MNFLIQYTRDSVCDNLAGRYFGRACSFLMMKPVMYPCLSRNFIDTFFMTHHVVVCMHTSTFWVFRGKLLYHWELVAMSQLIGAAHVPCRKIWPFGFESFASGWPSQQLSLVWSWKYIAYRFKSYRYQLCSVLYADTHNCILFNCSQVSPEEFEGIFKKQ